jgi:PAS domain S-box-containing protein
MTGADSEISKSLRGGQVLVIESSNEQIAEESSRSAFVRHNILAVVCAPVMKEGRMVGMLGVHQNRPRAWSSDEVELVQIFAERTWSELERARAQQAVGRSEQRLRRTLEAATVGVMVRDASDRVIYANRPLLAMLRLQERDVLMGDVRWSDIVDESRADAEFETLRELRETGRCRPYETELVARDGTKVPVYVGASMVPDSEGDDMLIATFITDLTPLKAAEVELVRLNADLERRVQERTAELRAANREMEGFTYAVAHDLRAPLRAIIATASIVLNEAGDDLSEEHRYLLTRQAANAQHLAHLLDDLLIYARIARQEVKAKPVDLSELVHRIAEDVGHGRSNPIQVQEGLTAVADPSLLRLLVQNLLDNACKFSPSGTPVEFGRAESPQGLAFYVRDYGVGFDMNHAGKLFEPFVRLVGQTDFPGTGIGLANVKRVVERHGGEVWAQSKPGEGATFWFTLRIDAPAEA